MRAYHLLLLKRGCELLLAVIYHAHFELALAYSGLPPPVFKAGILGGLRGDIQCASIVLFNIYQVVYYGLGDVFFLCNIFGVDLVRLNELSALLHHGGGS